MFFCGIVCGSPQTRNEEPLPGWPRGKIFIYAVTRLKSCSSMCELECQADTIFVLDRSIALLSAVWPNRALKLSQPTRLSYRAPPHAWCGEPVPLFPLV